MDSASMSPLTSNSAAASPLESVDTHAFIHVEKERFNLFLQKFLPDYEIKKMVVLLEHDKPVLHITLGLLDMFGNEKMKLQNVVAEMVDGIGQSSSRLGSQGSIMLSSSSCLAGTFVC